MIPKFEIPSMRNLANPRKPLKVHKVHTTQPQLNFMMLSESVVSHRYVNNITGVPMNQLWALDLKLDNEQEI